MNDLEICRSNIAVGQEVRDFILNVPTAKEESITDFLIWRWRALDARFNYINTKTFTRFEESTTTGADFELELWLVGQKKCVPLLFQAKKFLRPFDSYVQKLNYPAGTQQQLKTLLAYASAKRLLPFYAIYTASLPHRALCEGGREIASGVYMADALTIKEFADGAHGRKVALNAILAMSNPFHCMFCCPQMKVASYFEMYFKVQQWGPAARGIEELPGYARQIKNMGSRHTDAEGPGRAQIDGDLPPVHAVGVYDLTRSG